MKCKKCGSEIPEGSKFCLNCGKKAVQNKNSDIRQTGSNNKTSLFETIKDRKNLDPAQIKKTAFKLTALITTALAAAVFLCGFLPFIIRDNAPYSGVSVEQFIKNWNAAAEQNSSGVTGGVKIEGGKNKVSPSSLSTMASSGEMMLRLEREGSDISQIKYNNEAMITGNTQNSVRELLALIPGCDDNLINKYSDEFIENCDKGQSGINAINIVLAESAGSELNLDCAPDYIYLNSLKGSQCPTGLDFGLTLEEFCGNYNAQIDNILTESFPLSSSEEQNVRNFFQDYASFNLGVYWGNYKKELDTKIIDIDSQGRIIVEVDADMYWYNNANDSEYYMQKYYILGGQLSRSSDGGLDVNVLEGGRNSILHEGTEQSDIDALIEKIKNSINFGATSNGESADITISNFIKKQLINGNTQYKLNKNDFELTLLEYDSNIFAVQIKGKDSLFNNNSPNYINIVLSALLKDLHFENNDTLTPPNYIYENGVFYQCIDNNSFCATAMSYKYYSDNSNRINNQSYIDYILSLEISENAEKTEDIQDDLSDVSVQNSAADNITQPSPSPEPEPIYAERLRNGSAIDLDGDRKVDVINYNYSDDPEAFVIPTLSINNTTVELAEWDAPDCRFYLGDIDPDDNYKEIFAYIPTPIADTLKVFRYSNGDIQAATFEYQNYENPNAVTIEQELYGEVYLPITLLGDGSFGFGKTDEEDSELRIFAPKDGEYFYFEESGAKPYANNGSAVSVQTAPVSQNSLDGTWVNWDGYFSTYTIEIEGDSVKLWWGVDSNAINSTSMGNGKGQFNDGNLEVEISSHGGTTDLTISQIDNDTIEVIQSDTFEGETTTDVMTFVRDDSDPFKRVPGSDFDANGFVFADSSDRYLTREEIMNLANNCEMDFKDLLGYARNEIYARHKNAFHKLKYMTHYGQYDWYYNDWDTGTYDIDSTLHKVEDSELSEIERANVYLIAEIEDSLA